MNGNGQIEKPEEKVFQLNTETSTDDLLSQLSIKKRFNNTGIQIERAKKLMLHISLFVLTCLATWYVGGLWYAVAIMTILTAHEMGHYLMCRKYKIKVTLPFFIPFPLRDFNPFGTLGAVIKIGERLPTRKAIFDVGITGPLSGLFFTIPALIIGLRLSAVAETSRIDPGIFHLGESFLFAQLSRWIIGDIPDGYELMLHPVAYAGWVGLFVTALNLLPIGQLDGGHVMYALFGSKSEIVFKIMLAIFSIISAIFYPGWLLFIIMIIIVGYRHPPAVYSNTKINPKRVVIGYLTFIIFVLSFTPVPFYFT